MWISWTLNPGGGRQKDLSTFHQQAINHDHIHPLELWVSVARVKPRGCWNSAALYITLTYSCVIQSIPSPFPHPSSTDLWDLKSISDCLEVYLSAFAQLRVCVIIAVLHCAVWTSLRLINIVTSTNWQRMDLFSLSWPFKEARCHGSTACSRVYMRVPSFYWDEPWPPKARPEPSAFSCLIINNLLRLCLISLRRVRATLCFMLCSIHHDDTLSIASIVSK